MSACEDMQYCTYHCGGDGCDYGTNYPDGEDTYKTTDHQDEWVCIEYERDVPNQTSKLYITTRNGSLSGTYVTRSDTQDNSGATFDLIEIIGGYFDGTFTASVNNYLMFDELVISNDYIGPPDGFLTSTRKLNNVTGVRVTLH